MAAHSQANIQTLLQWAQTFLAKGSINNVQRWQRVTGALLLESNDDYYSQVYLEISVLLAHVLKVSRTYLYAWPEQAVSGSQKRQFEALVARRLKGEPIAYLVGYKEFWSLPLMVSHEVLIPRSETELLVECALKCVIASNKKLRVLDLGTGCGAAALALANEQPSWEIIAVDKKRSALNIARQNAKNLAINNIKFYQSDWFSVFKEDHRSFNIIVSNPPYVAPQDPHLKWTDSRYEPTEALVAGENGLQDLKFIISHATNYLMQEGWLILEHGFDQAWILRKWMQSCGFVQIKSVKDLAGIERIVIGQKTSSSLPTKKSNNLGLTL
jgi:release factor glutamine methyltransferase